MTVEFIKHWLTILGGMLIFGGAIAALCGVGLAISTLIDRGHVALGIILIVFLLSIVFAGVSYNDRNQSDAQFV